MTIDANSSELAQIPTVIEAFVPSLDLSALEAITSKFKVLQPGTLSLEIETKTGKVPLTLNLKP